MIEVVVVWLRLFFGCCGVFGVGVVLFVVCVEFELVDECMGVLVVGVVEMKFGGVRIVVWWYG